VSGNGHNGHHEPPLPVDAAFKVPFEHRLRFTRDALHPENPVLRDMLASDEGPRPLAAFVDRGVADAWPDIAERIADYLDDPSVEAELAAPVEIVAGGEAAKNDRSVYDRVTRLIHDAGICRHSYVMAIGGGAVLDAVGFAAATAHRGVRLLRLPSTTLAQGDAGIGVKNGINAFGKKNFLGSFAVPWAVINDEAFLTTLSDRDWRCGLSEAVKVALLKDPAFLDLIDHRGGRLRDRDEVAARPVIRRSAELHLQHIAGGGDPFELGGARPLDFGHWSAHKLEQLSDFEIRHGEAVAIGVAVDVLYSAIIGRLAGTDAERIVRLLQRLGFELSHECLRDPALFDGLEEFREHLGGRMAITLLDGIGRPFETDEIDTVRMKRAIRHLAAMATA
jgi:3-dehydroquinate synthase